MSSTVSRDRHDPAYLGPELSTTEPVRPRILISRAEQVKHEVLRMLLEGDFAPEERIDQKALADRLGVSRTPLHEAFVALRADGLFNHDKHHGTFAPSVDRLYLRDHLDLLAGVYASLATAATVRSDATALQRVVESSRGLSDGRSGDNQPGQLSALLSELRQAGRSRVLSDRARSLHLLVPEEAVLDALASTATRTGLDRFVDALERRDGARAASSWLQLFDEASSQLVHSLSG